MQTPCKGRNTQLIKQEWTQIQEEQLWKDGVEKYLTQHEQP
jgi:hypothetical protein